MSKRDSDRIAVGLIGSGIQESLSPALHEREAKLLGLVYSYELFDLDELGRPPEDVGAMVREAQEQGFRGLNVTHPCKQLVVDELMDLSSEAGAIEAVNTIVFRDGRTVGHNTDASAFREAFGRNLPDARTGRVVLLGAGGAGAAVAHAMLSIGAGRLTIVDAEPERAEQLATVVARRFGPDSCATAELDTLDELLESADGLIHATPTGMVGHPGTAVPSELLDPGMWIADVVYMPIETTLLSEARARGCRTLDGAAMVALQAAGSLELFTGVEPDADRMLAHVETLIQDGRQAA